MGITRFMNFNEATSLLHDYFSEKDFALYDGNLRLISNLSIESTNVTTESDFDYKAIIDFTKLISEETIFPFSLRPPYSPNKKYDVKIKNHMIPIHLCSIEWQVNDIDSMLAGGPTPGSFAVGCDLRIRGVIFSTDFNREKETIKSFKNDRVASRWELLDL